MHSSRRPAVLRGFAAASVAIFAALAGHVTAGGAMPGPLGIGVPWALSFMVCVLLAGRRLSVIRLTISVLISQFLFHVLFVLGTITPTGTVGGHVHGTPLVLPAIDGISAAAAADGMMWTGHALAALTTILVLHRGERLLLALRVLAERSVRWVQRRVDVLVSAPAPRPATAVLESREPETLRDLSSLTPQQGRAPPAPLAV